MNEIIEMLAEKVHNAWWNEKTKQGFHPPLECDELPEGDAQNKEAFHRQQKFNKHCNWCHTDMYPYKELAENTKEYDRVTVRAVIKALAESASII